MNLTAIAFLGPTFFIPAAWAAVPDPYVRRDEPTVGPAPMPVMEQAFWVQLRLDPATPVEVKTPDGIHLLDRTKPGQGRQWTRFYFRAERGFPATHIEFLPAGQPPLRVPLRVLSYREDIEDKSQDLPGFSPTVRKQGRSFYTDDRIALAQANLAKYESCRAAVQRKTKYDRLTDEQLWHSLPSWNLPRQCYGNWPCPFCGEKIYQKNAFYPWLVEGPFRCKCPDCGRIFPTNDLANDDFTSGDFPDDGWGWDSTGQGRREEAYGWVGYAVERHWMGTGHTILQLALRCLLLGDREAGHRASVLLARLAYVYPGMDMRWQQVLPRYLRVGKIELDQQWDASGIAVPALQAYDALWDYLGTDQELVRFLHTKDPNLQTPDDVRALIDVYLVQHVGLNFLRRWYHGDNGGWEQRMANIALLAAMDGSPSTAGRKKEWRIAVSDRWLHELFTHAYNTGADQGGFQDSMFVNYLTREGLTNIGSLGYSQLSIEYMDALAEALSRYPTAAWKSQCNLYDDRLYPRFRAALETFADFQVAGQFLPCYGDASNPRGWRGNLVAEYRSEYERAYLHWQSDLLAWKLFRLGRRDPGLFDVDLWDTLTAHVQRLGPEPPASSRVFDGVGMAFLEARSGEPDLKDRAGLTLRYGYGWGHSHHDNLNVEFWAKNQPVVPELGYPTWVHSLGSTGHTVHHVTGMVDHGSQYSGATGKGALEMFAAAPEASFVEGSAQPTGFPARLYRRAVALLEAPGKNSYVFDVFRLQGGTVRTYCFHGPPYDDFQCALPFGEKGEPLFTNLLEPQQAVSDGDVVADWKYQEQPLHLRLTMLGQTGRRYLTARFGKVDAPPIRFLLAEDEAADGASQFVALWEPYEEEPFIEKVERLGARSPIPREGEGGSPVGVRVTLAGGQVDTLLYAPETVQQESWKADGLEFRGTFGYVSQEEGSLRCLHLVGGDRLLQDGWGLAMDAAAYQAKIVAVDLREGKVTLDRPLPLEVLDGRQMNIVSGGKHRTSYRIVRVLPPGNGVQVQGSPKIFQSKLEGIGETGDCLVCEIAPPIEAVRGFPAGYYDGALLTDESLTARYRVVRVEGQKVYVDRPVQEEDFAALDPYGRRMVQIFDFGEGDEVTIYNSAFLRREAGDRWALQTTADLRLLWPADSQGAGLAYRGADGRWHRLEGIPGPDGPTSYVLRLEQLQAGRTLLRLNLRGRGGVKGWNGGMVTLWPPR